MAVRRFILALVVGVAIGCSPASSNLALPARSATPGAAGSSAPSLVARASSSLAALPAHGVIAGANVAGAFDMTTDGVVIAWSSGTIDRDAPELWVFDTPRGESRLVYRSTTTGAILATLAVAHGTYAFAEVTPRRDGSRTWRLVLVDAHGAAHFLDVNDLPSAQSGVLPMAAISNTGVLWAVSHAGDATGPRCELRYAALTDLTARVVLAAPCDRTEVWFPRSDGQRFVYGTVEYGTAGGADERHVYLVTDGDLAHPRRLDTDGQASMPAVLGDTVVWKAAPPEMNMLSPAGLVLLSLAPGGRPMPVRFPSLTPVLMTAPSIGLRFIVGEDTGGGNVTAWDRVRAVAVDIDRLAPTDPGFISGTRLVGDLLAWFYTGATGGGGTREIRWLTLHPG